jgi:hypothetical protein
MNQLDSITRISSLLSRFVAEVKALNAINQYGINFLAETVLVPIFKIVFDLPNLSNLNTEENNVAGIDLGDQIAKVAFQITSSSDNDKVKHTLRQFIKFEHFINYKVLYIYMLSEKQNNYKDSEYNEILSGQIEFSKNIHILDFRDLLKKINAIEDFEKVKDIEILLEKQFSDTKLDTFKNAFSTPQTEILYSNLLSFTFPDKIYIADLSIGRKDIAFLRGKKFLNDREIIFAYKKQNGLRFSADWIDFNKKIISFHDLSNTNHDLSKIIDLGTVELLSPSEFYEISSPHLRAFKALLKYTFSKQMFYLNVNFYHDENMFVFLPEDENVVTRTESWNTGRRTVSRDVIRMKRNIKTNHVWYYTHLAFSLAFRNYESVWYVELTPEWFITKDGKQKHYFQHEEVTSFLKKNERNQHVLNHVKFLANYLRYGKNQGSIFSLNELKPLNFLQFGTLLTFKNAPYLDELAWKTNETEEHLKIMQDKDGTIEF